MVFNVRTGLYRESFLVAVVFHIEKLPVGEYTLREVTAPDGYEVAEDVKFKVEETGDDRNPLIWLVLFGIGGCMAGDCFPYFRRSYRNKEAKAIEKIEG